MRKIGYLLILAVIFVVCNNITAQVIKPLPYQEDFDNYDPAVTKLPEGWTFEGKDVFKIGAYNEGWIFPHTAPYYITVQHNNITYPRNEWLFTNGFNMKQGVTYYVNFWIYAPGHWITYIKNESIKITAGTAASSEGQTITIKDFRKHRFSVTEWTLVEGEFTPETSGVYYVGLNAYTDEVSNGIGIDNFEIYSEEDPFPVQAKYIAKGGVWSALDSDIKLYKRYVYPDQEIEFTNKSRYATSYEWNTFGDPAISTEENLTVKYAESGFYTPTVTATNTLGSDTFKDTLNVTVLGKEEVSAIISNQDKYDGRGLRTPGDLFNNAYEFICGMNRYYNTYAEKFEMPSYAKVRINGFSLMLFQYKLATKDRNRPVSIKIYGDAYGVPDPDKVFGTYNTTMAGAFGTASFVGDAENVKPITITFNQPIEATGTFYIAIEIDPTLTPSSTTLLGTLCFKKADKDTKAFVYIPEKDVIPEPELNVSEGWYPLNELPEPLDDLEGLSFYFAPRVTFLTLDPSSINETDNSNIAIYPTIFNDILTIDANEQLINEVILYSMDGKVVYNAVINDTKISIPTSSFNNGIYFVKVKGKGVNYTMKVVKLCS